MKKIKLKENIFVKVSDSDYEELSKYKWTLKGDGYCHRSTPRPNRKWILMHRAIMNAKDGMQVDHINGNRLDNRRANLRLCLPQQNKMNVSITSRNTSGYKGVSRHKNTKYWRVRVSTKTIGYFTDVKEAAQAYNDAAIKEFGQFAKLNILKEN